MAREEAEREVQLFVSAQPFAGPNRRLLAEMALDGSPEQQIAALATYADWRNAGRSDHGHRDEDYRAAYDGVRSGLARHFSEWSQALDMGEGFIDHLDQRAMAVMAGEDMAPNERSRLEDALRDHFLALRAGGTPAVEVPAPPVPPPATATLAPESEEVWEATLRVQGAVHVLDPADLDSGERPEISIAVDDGEWTVRLEYYPFPSELVHVVLVPKGSPTLLRHSAAGWYMEVDGQALTLTPVGEAVVESGRIAIVSAPPDTARRSMRYTAAWAAAWPWGACFSTGGDGTVPVLVGHTPDGVLQAVVLANCTCEEEDEHPWWTLDRLAIRRVPLTVTAMIVLFLGGDELAWRWISLLPIGDPIDRYLRYLPHRLAAVALHRVVRKQAQALAAPVGAAHPGHRPRLVLPRLDRPAGAPAARATRGGLVDLARGAALPRRARLGGAAPRPRRWGGLQPAPHGRCAPQLPSG